MLLTKSVSNPLSSTRLPSWDRLTKTFAAALLLLCGFAGAALAQSAGSDLSLPVSPETTVPNAGGVTFDGIIAVLGGIIITARGIVMMTPTPKDNAALEKVIAVLKKIGLHIGCMALAAALLFTGCARFNTTQKDTSYENGKPVRKITTRATATTFFESKSQLTNWKARQTDKTQGATVGALNQEANATNAVAAIESVVKAAVEAAVKAVKP